VITWKGECKGLRLLIQDPLPRRGGYPLGRRSHPGILKRKEKPMFSTKQRVLILITQPPGPLPIIQKNPTLREIQRGLREHFGITRTRRHIRRLLCRLESEGVIRRENRSALAPRLSRQEQATRYEIVDFDRAFQNHLSLTRHAKVIVARERRRRRRKEARALHPQGKLRAKGVPPKKLP